ncbi:MAG: ASKHA domain-containing protein [Syntrophales bacterium]|nr:ASKHA domain-containing protein [Syntrophales bacterium]MDD5640277.1 ASKHA domain-containing protein [Syntrophales bacterium]
MAKKITFNPYGLTIEVPEGENLLRAALAAGVHINASCGGEGVCGKCKILVEEGEVDSLPGGLLTNEEWDLGYRQACQTKVVSDVVVRIPPESLLDRRTLTRRRTGIGLRPSPIDLASLQEEGLYNPAFKKRCVKLSPPSLTDNVNDLARLEEGLARQHGVPNLTLDFFLLRKLARVMREQDFQVTATLDFSRRRFRSPHLVNVEPGDTTGRHYAVAVDIGTTTVWVQLLDLSKGEIIGHAADYNSQMSYGDDVITRIVYSQKEQGLQKLQKSVVGTINQVMHRLLKQHKLGVEEVSHMTVAANTTMTHLFYGIDPKYIRLAPYVPTAGSIPLLRARDLGLEMPEHVFVYSVSSVSSYVGGDIVSGVLASGLYKEPRLTLFIDIGTNGEIVIGNQQWMACAACSAGPAFEGGGIRFGMRATQGAIEEVSINPETFEPMLLTIGMAKPKGICGSGLINLLAALMDSGLVHPNGKFRDDLNTPRVRLGDSGREYVVAFAEDTQGGQDLVLSEADIDNLMRAKGAMFAGYVTLLESVGLHLQDLEQVILAGAFGNFVNIDNAIAIGLLPDLPRDRYQFVGNASLLGATLLAFSREMLDEERRVAEMMTNFELSETPGYMDQYIAALFLPHTQGEYFPSVSERLQAAKG